MTLIGTTLKTSTVLFIGQTVASLILAVVSFALARLFLPASFGLYSIALVPLFFVQPIRDWGIPTGVQQRTSEYLCQESYDKIKSMGVNGSIWVVFTGFILSLALGLLLPTISAFVGNEVISGFIVATLPLVSFAGIYKVCYGFLIGLDRPLLASGLFVGSALAKLVLSVGLVLVGYGVMGALIGFSIAYTGSALVSLLLILKSTRNLPSKDQSIPKESLPAREPEEKLIELVRFSSPIGLADVSSMLLDVLLPIVGIFYLSTYDFGIYSAARVLYVQVIALFTPFILTLISAFSKMRAISANSDSRNFNFATQISAIPISVIGASMILLAEPLIFILYGADYIAASELLILFCITFVFLAPFGCFSFPPLALASGLVDWYGATSLIAAVIAVVFSILLVPLFSYYALAFLVFLAMFLRTALIGFGISRQLKISLNFRKTARLLLSTLLSIIAGLLTKEFLGFSGAVIANALSLIAFAATFFLAIVGFKAVALHEVEQIYKAVESVPVLSGFYGFIIRMMRLFQRD